MALPVLQPIPGLDLCPRALPRGWALLSGMLCRACDLAPTAVTACFGQIQPAASLFALFFFFFFFFVFKHRLFHQLLRRPQPSPSAASTCASFRGLGTLIYPQCQDLGVFECAGREVEGPEQGGEGALQDLALAPLFLSNLIFPRDNRRGMLCSSIAATALVFQAAAPSFYLAICRAP